MLSVVKAYWAKVGVNLELRVKDSAVFVTMGRSQSYQHGIMDLSGISGPVETSKLTRSRVGGEQNYSKVDNSFVEETNEAFIGAYFDPVEHARIVREATPELQRLAHHIKLPAPQMYSVWQPWIKGFHGEIEVDYHSNMI